MPTLFKFFNITPKSLHNLMNIWYFCSLESWKYTIAYRPYIFMIEQTVLIAALS